MEIISAVREPGVSGFCNDGGPKVSVLHVAETIKGGVASYLSLLDKGLSDEFDFKYLIPGSQLEGFEVDADIYEHNSSRSLIGVVRLSVAMVRLSRRLASNAVYAHSTFAGLALCLALPFLRKNTKTIYCPHGWAHFMDVRPAKRAAIQCVERVISFLPSITVNISKFEHENVLSKGFSKKSVLISNSVPDLPRRAVEEVSANGPLRILFVGRFDRQKGVDLLFSAINNMCHENFIFDIVGSPVLAEKNVQFAPALPNVHYHGWLAARKITDLYNSADLVVVPSRWEGFGLCALEAFRSSTPVIATRVGGLQDLVIDKYNGAFFDGTSEGLAEALGAFPRERLRFMGENARNTYEANFNPTIFFGKYRRLLRELVSEKPVKQKGPQNAT